MTEHELKSIIADIQSSSHECEWIEIKRSNSNPETIGEYISALSNGAAYVKQSKGFLVFGLDDETHKIVGTEYNPQNEHVGNQEIENWLATQLNPRIDFSIHEVFIEEKRLVLFVIDSAGNIPVKFRGTAWIRVGSYKKNLAANLIKLAEETQSRRFAQYIPKWA